MAVPLVSVVTPVYNGEEYLAECIESVLGQTWPHWQYTIVNNCSTDGSLAIAESYAATDPRIRVVSNPEFLGQVDNLNRAMSLIPPESTFTKMVLADDWIFPRCLEKMVEVAEAHPSAGIVSAWRLDDRRVNCDGLPWPGALIDGRSICRTSLVENLFVSGTPTTLLYRSDRVRERTPFFPEGTPYEDTEVFYEILLDHDLGFVHEVLTFTRRENESLSTALKAFDPEHRLDKLIVTMKYGPTCLDEAEFRACRKQDENAYYAFLGRRCLYRTGTEFWSHHQRGMRRAGLSFSRGKFISALIGAGLRELVHPVRLLQRAGGLASRLMNNRRTSAQTHEAGTTGSREIR